MSLFDTILQENVIAPSKRFVRGGIWDALFQNDNPQLSGKQLLKQGVDSRSAMLGVAPYQDEQERMEKQAQFAMGFLAGPQKFTGMGRNFVPTGGAEATGIPNVISEVVKNGQMGVIQRAPTFRPMTGMDVLSDVTSGTVGAVKGAYRGGVKLGNIIDSIIRNAKNPRTLEQGRDLFGQFTSKFK